MRALDAVARPEPRRVDRKAAERVAAELPAALGAGLTTFPDDEGHDELVVVRDFRFQSLRLTAHVAGRLHERLAPEGVGVVLEAEHLCMSVRGVQKAGARTVTSALYGLVRDHPRTRDGFLALTGGRA